MGSQLPRTPEMIRFTLAFIHLCSGNQPDRFFYIIHSAKINIVIT